MRSQPRRCWRGGEASSETARAPAGPWPWDIIRLPMTWSRSATATLEMRGKVWNTSCGVAAKTVVIEGASPAEAQPAKSSVIRTMAVVAPDGYRGHPLPGTETTFESNIKAPAPPTHAPAIDLPHVVDPVFIVMSKAASMLPWNSQ